MKLYTIDNHSLHAWKRREDNNVLYRYEVELPDGTFQGIDVHPLVQIRQDVFKKWLQLGMPDRTSVRSPEALTISDIECYWDTKFGKPLRI